MAQSHSHSHVDAAEAEQLTGRFGARGDRHPNENLFESPEDGLTERRRRFMSAQSGHFRAMTATLLSNAGGEDVLQMHADGLAAMAAEIDRFCELGSPAPEGEKGALAKIWEEPDLFSEYTAAYREQAQIFAATVRDGGDLVNGLHDLRYFCVACHAEFRQR